MKPDAIKEMVEIAKWGRQPIVQVLPGIEEYECELNPGIRARLIRCTMKTLATNR